jgi:hypothetical protein
VGFASLNVEMRYPTNSEALLDRGSRAVVLSSIANVRVTKIIESRITKTKGETIALASTQKYEWVTTPKQSDSRKKENGMFAGLRLKCSWLRINLPTKLNQSIQNKLLRINTHA